MKDRGFIGCPNIANKLYWEEYNYLLRYDCNNGKVIVIWDYGGSIIVTLWHWLIKLYLRSVNTTSD